MNSAITGKNGEQAALKYYLAKGYTLLLQNFTVREGEIDIILQKGGTVVFAEVKTRGKNAIALPGEWVTPAKQRKIIKAALQYLAESGKSEMFVRFDVVEVIYFAAGNRYNVNCIKNAFECVV